MADNTHIQLAHGGGGQLSAELIEGVILPALGSSQRARRLTDAATLDLDGRALAFTTDSYVVWPIEFPGGDIGKLAVCGTLNDLAVSGARPRAMSLAMVIPEGLEIALLVRVLRSAGQAAAEAGVEIVTGDTKVVARGELEGLILNTAGVGEQMDAARLGFEHVRAGDRLVLSGALGEHGLAVMSQRKGLSFSAELESDCASLAPLCEALLGELGPAVRFMRDPTRGGLAATLNELARGTDADVEIDEQAIPVNPTARAASELLGLDLLTVANEGKLLAVVAEEAGERAVQILRTHRIGARAALVGEVREPSQVPLVELRTAVGGRRIVQMPHGEQLPRIC